jgi:Protein of unknown function (DUF2786).
MTDKPDQEKRSALLDKISALLAKTQINGCTEKEALAAVELAQKLMAKHGLSLSELETISSPIDACEVDRTPAGDKRCHEVVHLAPAIAFYTDTKAWYNGGGIIHAGQDEYRQHEHRGMILCFFGLPADVQVAIYLTETLRRALDSEWRTFWRDIKEANQWDAFWGDAEEPKVSARTVRWSFMEAITMRLSDRLREMKEAQSRSKNNSCREIVLAKERIVQAAFDAAEIKIRSAGYRGPSGIDVSAWDAGNAAGDRVSINSGELETNR